MPLMPFVTLLCRFFSLLAACYASAAALLPISLIFSFVTPCAFRRRFSYATDTMSEMRFRYRLFPMMSYAMLDVAALLIFLSV